MESSKSSPSEHLRLLPISAGDETPPIPLLGGSGSNWVSTSFTKLAGFPQQKLTFDLLDQSAQFTTPTHPLGWRV